MLVRFGMRRHTRVAPGTVQRVAYAFAAPVENMGTDHLAISDSVPVGVPQMADAPESLCFWLEDWEMIAVWIIYCGRRAGKRGAKEEHGMQKTEGRIYADIIGATPCGRPGRHPVRRDPCDSVIGVARTDRR
jgi:hypothetical protein